MTPFTGFDYFSLDDLLSDEDRVVRRTVREFVEREALPLIEAHHASESFPRDLIPRMAQLGFFGANLKDHGCAGLGNIAYGLICQELSAAQDRLLLLGRKTALERLVSFVLGIADRQAKTRGASTGDVRLPMNRSDIADYLALTVETVSRLLTHLRSRGFIDLPTPNHIVLLKPQMLESIASGEA